MAGKGVKSFTAGSKPGRKVMVSSVPTKQLNNRRVFVAKNVTLNARFTMLSSMRQHASQQQSEGRDSLLAKRRGLKAADAPASSQGKSTGKPGGKAGKKGKKKGIALSTGPKVRPTAVESSRSKPNGKRRGGQRKKNASDKR